MIPWPFSASAVKVAKLVTAVSCLIMINNTHPFIYSLPQLLLPITVVNIEVTLLVLDVIEFDNWRKTRIILLLF